MKKAQTQQVFIYMMVIIVVGAVLLIGYRSIDNVLERGCDVEMSTFRSNLEDDLNRNTRFGNVANNEYRAPCSVDEVCFVDSDADELDSDYEFIQEEVSAGTEQDVFLLESEILQESLSIGNIEVDDIVCVENRGGNIDVRMEGTGNSVKVSAMNVEQGTSGG